MSLPSAPPRSIAGNAWVRTAQGAGRGDSAHLRDLCQKGRIHSYNTNGVVH
jgi:hypothetical protein